MPTYRLYSDYGFAGSSTDLGEIEADSLEEAEEQAWELAVERVSSWVEEVE